ncbi:MAG: 4-hydroxy-tetrahydrodipicolinate synthase [Candidatus Hydrogenedentota bacterium]|nr:MAG: 4-hydroxy-tetrahydrodipicolinate synthase [Candidatus Hydrogenedentota bacterium]
MITGTFTALITPFRSSDGSVDFEALKNLIAFQIKGGVEGVVPCGTTGESPTLTHKEHREVIAKVVEWTKEIDAEKIVIAGTGSNSTSEAIELTQAAGKDGADYALVVNPYYNKPTQEGLYKHFMSIADASEIPLVLYNIPGRTAVKLERDTIVKLANHPNIVAIKEATGDLNFMTDLVAHLPKDFSLLSGDDNLLLPILSIGGRGVISVISNVFPKETSQITRLYMDGNIQEAREKFFQLFPLCKAMFIETNPIPVKYAASLTGLCENVLRLPMTPLSKDHESTLRSLIREFSN